MSTSAPDILTAARECIADRASERDLPAERSMKRCVEIFNAITRRDLTELEGWQFQIALKLARASAGAFKLDDYVDGASYFGLAGECAADAAVVEAPSTQQDLFEHNQAAPVYHSKLNEMFRGHRPLGDVAVTNLINTLRDNPPVEKSVVVGCGQYKTRSGVTAVVDQIIFDDDSPYPVSGYLLDQDGGKYPCTWTPEGKYDWEIAEMDEDLVEHIPVIDASSVDPTEITQPEIDAALATEEAFRASLQGDGAVAAPTTADEDLIFNPPLDNTPLPTDWQYSDAQCDDGAPTAVLSNEVRAAAAAVPPVAESKPLQMDVGEYLTRDGCRAVVEDHKKRDTYPWTGRVYTLDGTESYSESWTDTGRYHVDHNNQENDLVERIS